MPLFGEQTGMRVAVYGTYGVYGERKDSDEIKVTPQKCSRHCERIIYFKLKFKLKKSKVMFL